MSDWVTAFAPASIGNVGVGFDMLGLALEGAGDRVLARRTAGGDVSVAEVRGLDGELHPYLRRMRNRIRRQSPRKPFGMHTEAAVASS